MYVRRRLSKLSAHHFKYIAGQTEDLEGKKFTIPLTFHATWKMQRRREEWHWAREKYLISRWKDKQVSNRCLRIQNYGFVPTRFPLLPGKPRRPSTPSLPWWKKHRSLYKIHQLKVLTLVGAQRLTRTGLEVPHVRVHFSRFFMSRWNLQTLVAV